MKVASDDEGNGSQPASKSKGGSRLKARNPPDFGASGFDETGKSKGTAYDERRGSNDQKRRSRKRTRPSPEPESPHASAGHCSPNEHVDVEAESLDDSARQADEFVDSMWQSSPRDGQKAFRVLPWVVSITRTKAELLVLSQFVYWFGVSEKGTLRAKVERNGYWWVYKTYGKLARELGLTRDQTRGAIRRLTAQGILVADDDVNAGHTVHYRLSGTAIQQQIESEERRRDESASANEVEQEDEDDE